MKVQTSQEFHPKNVLSVDLWKNSNTWKISMKVQTSQEFHRKCTDCVSQKNSDTIENIDEKTELLKSFIVNVLSLYLWKIPTLEKISMKDQTSQEFHRKNVLSVDLWKIPHLENIVERPNFSKDSSKMY